MSNDSISFVSHTRELEYLALLAVVEVHESVIRRAIRVSLVHAGTMRPDSATFYLI